MARCIAKNIVFAELADECQSQSATPSARLIRDIQIDTFGTGKVSDAVIAKAVNDVQYASGGDHQRVLPRSCSFASIPLMGISATVIPPGSIPTNTEN